MEVLGRSMENMKAMKGIARQRQMKRKMKRKKGAVKKYQT